MYCKRGDLQSCVLNISISTGTIDRARCLTLSSASVHIPHVARCFLLTGSINGQILYVSRSSCKAAFFIGVWLWPQWGYVEKFS